MIKSLLFLLVFTSAMAAEETSIFQSSIESGLAYIDKGDIQSAMNSLRKGINCHRMENVAAKTDLAQKTEELLAGETQEQKKAAYRVYLAVLDLTQRSKDHDKALSLLDQAEKDDPQLPEIYNTRGVAEHLAGHLDQALADYSKAIELNPRYVDALVNRAGVYLRLKQMDLAIKDYAAYQDLLNSLYYNP